jgi:hypothetical protein
MPDAHTVRTEDIGKFRECGIPAPFDLVPDLLGVELAPTPPAPLWRKTSGGIGAEISVHGLSRDPEALCGCTLRAARLYKLHNPFA